MYRPILMDSSDIRIRLRVSRQRCYQIVGRRDFPKPYQTLVLGRVWDAAEVEAWIRTHRPHLANKPPGRRSTPTQNG